MFTNSQAYLGGANGNRIVPPQYGQPQQPVMSTQYPVSTQPTGFAQLGSSNQIPGLLSSQHNGQDQQYLRQQATGWQGPPSGANQASLNQFPQQSYQQTGSNQLPYNASQPPQYVNNTNGQSHLQPAKTGQTSSQIAQSFGSLSNQTSIGSSRTPLAKIPPIRLSFLTATDQAKFEQLFKSAVGDAGALDGEKCKDLLLRSNLPGSDLMKIWTLSDTTKSGQLLFPEFALAMYLCNLRLVGKGLPDRLPETLKNEVSSMVDIISFGVPDDRQQPTNSNAPNFSASANGNAQSMYQPQPQASNSQLLSQLTAQPTGFAAQYIPPNPTGFPLQQQAPLNMQMTGVPNQQQFSQGLHMNTYPGPVPPMPPIPPTFQAPNNSAAQTGGTFNSHPLNSQPTGQPTQWALVNTPATGLPNIDALRLRMMPQPGREGGFTTAGLSGTATIPWAVTKDEKKIYDQLFRAWDGLNKGFIGGDVAIEVMGQSGLPKTVLEQIWTLSDPSNKGRLDLDEFAVAMHLIYRKLNGYPVPSRLPPELVPPSTRNLSSSIDAMKGLLTQDAELRKTSGAFLQPQKTGVSYLKTRTFRSDQSHDSSSRKDATVFRHDDEKVGYKSSARRRIRGDGRTPSPAPSTSSLSGRSSDDTTAEDLRKQLREKKIVLDAMKYEQETTSDKGNVSSSRVKEEIDELFLKIRQVQKDTDSHIAKIGPVQDVIAKKQEYRRQLQKMVNRLPELATEVRKVERSIADSKLELFRLKDVKAHPLTATAMRGTGPGGTMTENDRVKARARALMQQRSAALTGKKLANTNDDIGAAERRLEEESLAINTERETNERMIKDVEESVQQFTKTIEDSLAIGSGDEAHAYERRKWEDGIEVQDQVRNFIFELRRNTEAAQQQIRESTDKIPGLDRTNRSSTDNSTAPASLSDARVQNKQNNNLQGSSPAYKTAEERAAFIKQQAERRMAERLAALGIKPPSRSNESMQQRADREEQSRKDRLRQAEEDELKKDNERQQRISNERPRPPENTKSAKKPPPTPPTRKARSDSTTKPERPTSANNTTLSRIEIQDKEHIPETQDDGFERERLAAAERVRLLEVRVKESKLKKQEEKRRKQELDKETQDRNAKLVAQKAEMEAAKARERQLQLQLESIDDETSSDESVGEVVNKATSDATPPNGQHRIGSPQPQPTIATKIPEQMTPAYQPVSIISPASERSSFGAESKNPYLKRPNSVIAVAPTVSAESTNPFHRMAQKQADQDAIPPSRVRQDQDDWSVADSNSSSDDESEAGKPTGGSAKQLASILFGTMAPPRPLSSLDEQAVQADIPSQARAASNEHLAPSLAAPPPPPPPPPPPVPQIHAPEIVYAMAPDLNTGLPPSAPPPPPPPPPQFSAPPPPPPPPAPPNIQSGPSVMAASLPPVAASNRAGLFGDIQKGKNLKKVQTKDRSQASTAGRVLD